MVRDSSVSAGISRHRLVAVDDRLAVDEVPQDRAEAGAFSMISSHARAEATAPSIFMRLRTMPSSCIRASTFLLRVARDLLRREAVERAAESFALPQDGDPGKSRLKSVEHELLVERAVVALGHAPFLIVIGDIERVGAGPRAAPVAGLPLMPRASATGTAKRAKAGLAQRDLDPSRRQRLALAPKPPRPGRGGSGRAPRRRSPSRAFRSARRQPRCCVPEAGSGASPSTGTMRFRAVPRCSMRETTSWPT